MADIERMIARMHVLHDNGTGRSIEQLLTTDDILSGAESQRLRTYFASNCMEPSRDLDKYGWAVFRGDLDGLKMTYATSVAKYRKLEADGHPDNDLEEAARSSATQEIYKKRWGPTHVPIFNLILLSTLIDREQRAQKLAVAKWLMNEVKVPVDAHDLSGSTALHHAISTKPSFDSEYAKMLYDAGANVNNRNRYGGTSAHEITIVWDMHNREVVQKAADAREWFLEHDGNVDIKDSDGVTARRNVDISRNAARKGIRMGMWKVLDDEDKRRALLIGQYVSTMTRYWVAPL